MASILSVEQLRGLSSGDNPNTITIPAGQTLQAPGHVIQATEGRLTTRQGNNTQTFASVGLSASITPSSTSSKILVTVSVNSISCSTGSGVILRLKRGDSTYPISNTSGGTVDTDDGFFCGGGQIYTGQNRQRASGTISFLDEPSSTSVVTYDVEMRCTDASATAYINGLDISAGNGSVSTITLMEIAG
jgi:hypothetical protein